MDVYTAIKKRRDVRSWFSNEKIPDEIISKILMAGNYAPSVGLSQPWNFIIIKDIDIRKKIKSIVDKKRIDFYNSLPYNKKNKFERIKIEGILESYINIAVTCDFSRKGPDIIGRSTIRETSEYSVVLAIENMWLAARSENIGMGWVSFFDPEDVKDVLKIPESIKLIAYLTLGKLTEDHDIPELEEKNWEKRNNLSEYVFMDRWGNNPDKSFCDLIKNTKL
ncbi:MULTISPECIES: 5,6-dimethylbenzimidazole synthase [Acidiplasma]|uniref:5,6-dimethylbenzimidazole synthase n=2 Tax=Acidiplasma TaxID=507753 RepID=A0A0Q0RYG1_9ARCH|nr:MULTISPECIES: 5,6-dimethylbenzimidazole synthase [Acidiplasma]KJE50067.1 cob(II)yrinic acid a,c-diamide reductase [Acidiplasma sp. MBA-1]KPV46614.1 cob(II)yrinic acid a,c-diamide reductase [Acidiplasma aeolicum]KQB34382.1 5,6-dimethylbenzimidazole synthase [Acidiplasma aeolicum]KQB35253.1 5,6-dimethylbenzimidazole synthase [Acidiplasma cupricumulans]WMT55879.1 MAG: 5,6-dimethylbenzimidazole synthase [Acidiplasma sp.]